MKGGTFLKKCKNAINILKLLIKVPHFQVVSLKKIFSHHPNVYIIAVIHKGRKSFFHL
jgi:hypothetical protein